VIPVNINAKPDLTVGTPGPIFLCNAGSPTTTTLTANNPQGGWTYQLIDASTGSVLATQNGTASFPGIGRGQYQIRVVDSNTPPCDSISSVIVVDTFATPTVSVNIAPSATICSNSGTGTITLTATPGTGVTIPANNYQWILNGTPIAGATTNTLSATTSGNYALNFTDANGCTGTTNIPTLTVNNPPVALIAYPGDSSACQGLSVAINATPTGPNFTYVFRDASGAVVQSGNSPVYQATASGNYSVTITDQTTNCSATATTANPVTIKPLPVAQIVANPPVSALPGENVTFNSVGSFTVISWDLGDGSLNPGALPSVTHTYQTSGTYTVTLTVDQNGCRNTDTLQYLIRDDVTILIPNVLTPNGDGVNDELTIFTRGIQAYTMLVFDRWGNEIWSNEGNMNAYFQGLNKQGQAVPEGVYVFLLNAKDMVNRSTTRTGTITLLR
jgi:gliding motility-associated-like protein